MGGFGSGRRSEVKKPRVEAHSVALRVGELRRGGALRPDASGTLSWGPPSAPVASIKFRGTGSALIVSYYVAYRTDVPCLITHGDNLARLIMSDFEACFKVETVRLAPVPAGFGGTRSYFCCPDPECNRRVEALYLAGARFRCRRCHGLTYQSQYEDVERRVRRRANKRRARLRYEAWMPFALAPVKRPKGVWRRTFWRLQDSIDAGDYLACEAFAARLPHGRQNGRIAQAPTVSALRANSAGGFDFRH